MPDLDAARTAADTCNFFCEKESEQRKTAVDTANQAAV
jgi:hypothetical protein